MKSRFTLALLLALATACARNGTSDNGTSAGDSTNPGGAAATNAGAEASSAAATAAATATTTANAVYVDVRTPEEYAESHVAGAILIPYDQMPARWEELAAHRADSVIVYCRSGRRAGIALEVLKSNGFTRAVNGGGLVDMERTGARIESGSRDEP